jgi:hypothetical protein
VRTQVAAAQLMQNHATMRYARDQRLICVMLSWLASGRWS